MLATEVEKELCLIVHNEGIRSTSKYQIFCDPKIHIPIPHQLLGLGQTLALAVGKKAGYSSLLDSVCESLE